MKYTFLASIFLLLASCGNGSSSLESNNDFQAQAKPRPPATPSCVMPSVSNIKAVRFDASYYYGTGLTATQLTDQLTQKWAQNGVNTVYFMAYNPTYGARYQTTYVGNQMESWGELDLMGAMISSAKARNIKVVAWISDFRHGGAIAQNPSWASIDRNGANYSAGADAKFMTLASIDAEKWYQGFIGDIFTRYPGLAGLDIAEPLVNWWGDEADYSPAMNVAFAQAYPGKSVGGPEWRAFRTSLLNKHLQNTIRTVHGFCKPVHITATLTANAQGNLLSSSALAYETGFDLDGVLNNVDRPEVINAELMWQQWKASYGTAVFTPAWTQSAAQQARDMVDGRARLLVHVENSDFGLGMPTPLELQHSLQAAVAGGAQGLDIYDTHGIDTQNSWTNVAAVYSSTVLP